MTIRLQNVTKTSRVNGRPHTVLDNLTLEIKRGERIGVLGLPKSGKSTLLRIICGTERIDSGRVEADMTMSWPIPQAAFLSPVSTVAWNIRSLARIYGNSSPDFVARIAELAGCSEYLNTRLALCPPYVRGQLGFALGIGMDFDLYLFDNQFVPPRKEFKDAALRSLQERTAGKAVLLATALPPALAGRWDVAYVLEQGRLTRFAKIEDAQEHFKTLQKARAEREKEAAERRLADEGVDDSNLAVEESYAAADQAGAALSDF